MSKNYRTKIKLKIFFLSKIAIYLSLGLHKGNASYRRSLRPSKIKIQPFKRLNLLKGFLLFWAIIALLDPKSGIK
jgi:hypothetical protein